MFPLGSWVTTPATAGIGTSGTGTNGGDAGVMLPSFSSEIAKVRKEELRRVADRERLARIVHVRDRGNRIWVSWWRWRLRAGPERCALRSPPLMPETMWVRVPMAQRLLGFEPQRPPTRPNAPELVQAHAREAAASFRRRGKNEGEAGSTMDANRDHVAALGDRRCRNVILLRALVLRPERIGVFRHA
jgi:hypothetical protein